MLLDLDALEDPFGVFALRPHLDLELVSVDLEIVGLRSPRRCAVPYVERRQRVIGLHNGIENVDPSVRGDVLVEKLGSRSRCEDASVGRLRRVLPPSGELFVEEGAIRGIDVEEPVNVPGGLGLLV